jgi:hypothetical protein
MEEQLNEKFTDAENRIFDELFIAIYFNDLEKVIEIKEKHPEIYSKKENYKIEGKKSFDLKNLTFFNQSIWKEDDWKDEIIPFIKRNRENTEKMLKFWQAETGNENIKREIEYNQYCDYYYCVDPNDPEKNDKVILDTIPYFLEKGFREIDLMLYNRIACFDFEETIKLLEKGANPNVNFYENESDSNAIDFIGTECSYLASCQVVHSFQLYEKNGMWNYYNINNLTELFMDLIGLAAFEDMYYLLEKYIKSKTST